MMELARLSSSVICIDKEYLLEKGHVELLAPQLTFPEYWF